MALQSPESNKAAFPILERSIEIDPDFAEAHAWLAMTHHFGWMFWGHAVERHRSLAREAAKRAVLLDPDNADAHMIQGFVRAYDNELPEGIAEIETALRINPNHADAWALQTDLMVLDGQALKAIGCAQNAFRLNPFPPGVYYWVLGFAQYAAGQYKDAVETLQHDAARGTGSQRLLAGALAQLGRIAEAKEEARLYLARIPHFSVQNWSSTQYFRHDRDRQHFIDGYIKAGFPMRS
jgi:tetratricopeptide (TPR) repeat protein